MSMTGGLKVELPGVDFTAMAREAIAGELTKALVGADDAIAKIVAAAMTQKVSERGVVSNSSYENKTPFVEWIAQDLIRGAALAVVKAKVEKLRPAIEREVEKALTKNVKALANVLTESFVRNASSGYGITMNVSAEFNRRD